MVTSKKPTKKAKEKEENPFITLIITAVVVTVIYFSFFHKEREERRLTIPPPNQVATKETQNIGTQKNRYNEMGELIVKDDIVRKTPPPVPTATISPGHFDNYKKQQEALKNNFQNTARIEMDFPKELGHYTTLDLDDGLAGIMGIGRGELKEISVIATQKTINLNGVIEFLNESNSGIPTIRNLRFSQKNIIKVSPPMGTGVSEAVAIKADNDNGVYALYLKRSDGKGSYLLITKASSNFYDQQEGYLDGIFESLRMR